MRTTFIAVLVCAALVAAAWLLRAPFLVPSVDTKMTVPTGVLVAQDSAFGVKLGSRIDLSALLPLMRKASWSDQWVLWKGAFTIRLDDGAVLQIEQFAPMFRFEGVPGTYRLDGIDGEKFRTLRDDVIVAGKKPSESE